MDQDSEQAWGQALGQALGPAQVRLAGTVVASAGREETNNQRFHQERRKKWTFPEKLSFGYP
jgi:hypothetical protein